MLQAFGQVADILQALTHDANLVAAQKHALSTASEAVRLQRINMAVPASLPCSMRSGNTNRPNSVISEQRHSVTRIRSSSSSPWVEAGGAASLPSWRRTTVGIARNQANDSGAASDNIAEMPNPGYTDDRSSRLSRRGT